MKGAEGICNWVRGFGVLGVGGLDLGYTHKYLMNQAAQQTGHRTISKGDSSTNPFRYSTSAKRTLKPLRTTLKPLQTKKETKP